MTFLKHEGSQLRRRRLLQQSRNQSGSSNAYLGYLHSLRGPCLTFSIFVFHLKFFFPLSCDFFYFFFVFVIYSLVFSQCSAVSLFSPACYRYRSLPACLQSYVECMPRQRRISPQEQRLGRVDLLPTLYLPSTNSRRTMMLPKTHLAVIQSSAHNVAVHSIPLPQLHAQTDVLVKVRFPPSFPSAKHSSCDCVSCRFMYRRSVVCGCHRTLGRWRQDIESRECSLIMCVRG